MDKRQNPYIDHNGDRPAELVAAFNRSVADFINGHESVLHLHLEPDIFHLDMPIREWLDITHYDDYVRGQFSQNRRNSKDWKAGLPRIIKECKEFVLEESAGLGYAIMQMGVDDPMPLVIVPQDFVDPSDPLEGYLFIIDDVLRGAALAEIIPELESEYDELVVVGTGISDSPSTDVTSVGKGTVQVEELFNKVRWKKKSVPLLAYLFYRLEEEGLIQIENIGETVSAVFLDCDYRSITNKTINEYLSRFRNRTTKPRGKIQLDELIEMVKSVESS